MGILSVNFILTRTVECGFEVGDLRDVYYKGTGGEIRSIQRLINKGFPRLEDFLPDVW